MKKEVQGRWGRVATRCAASAWYVDVSRRGVDITKIMIAARL